MFRQFDSGYAAMNAILEDNGNTLYLGDCTAAYDRESLDRKGVKTVLTVASGLNVEYSGGIHHRVYNILDIESSNIARLFSDTHLQISEGLKRGNVLVHCAAGVSRSASVVIAYLMKTQNMKFAEAMAFVKRKRSVIFPNYGFQRQLRQFEKDLSQKSEIKVNDVKQPEELKKEEPKINIKMATTTTKMTSPVKESPKKDHRFTTEFARPKTNPRALTQSKFLIQSQYHSSYTGPHIVTHQKNKLNDKQLPQLSLYRGVQYKKF